MRYKTYFRRIMHNMAVEHLPFDEVFRSGPDIELGLHEEAALRLVNGWNRLSNGTHQYWIA